MSRCSRASGPVPHGHAGHAQVAADHARRHRGLHTRRLERREQFLGKRIDIASDEVAGNGVADILSRLSGRKIEYVKLPIGQVRATNEDFAKMFEWFNPVGYRIDIPGLRRQYPEVGWHTFEGWAKAQNWGVLRQAAAG